MKGAYRSLSSLVVISCPPPDLETLHSGRCCVTAQWASLLYITSQFDSRSFSPIPYSMNI